MALCIREDKPENMGSKLKQYPLIAKTISSIYGCRYSSSIKKIIGHRRKRPTAVLDNQISRIMTNGKAREKAEIDLKVLDYIGNKRIVYLDKDSNVLGIGKNVLTASIKRLNKLANACIEERFQREIEVK